MAGNLVFTFGRFRPDGAASIEELGEGRKLVVRKFPFVNGISVTDCGFAGRRWRARCLLRGVDFGALAARRRLLRGMTGKEDVLTISGESFAHVIIVPDKLCFAPIRNAGAELLQEVELEFLQLREDEQV